MKQQVILDQSWGPPRATAISEYQKAAQEFQQAAQEWPAVQDWPGMT
jgi:hypothetical protein